MSHGWTILIGSLHLGARLWGAEFRYGAIKKVDLIVEVDNYNQGPKVSAYCAVITNNDKLAVHCKPFIQILALGQLHSLTQTATAQSGLGELPQLVTAGALGGRAGLEGGSRPRIAGRC